MPPCTRTEAAHRGIADRALIAAFVLSLMVPALVMLAARAGRPIQARVTTEPAPAFGPGLKKMIGYPWAYCAWFRDHFGLRRCLIRWHARMQMGVFNVSSSKEVIVGKNGWLYYSGDNGTEIDEYRCVNPFTEAELERARQALEARQTWLARRGIQFVFMVAPDKAEVCSEHLPQWLKRVGTQSRLDQLISYLRAHSTINVLDVRPALLAAKERRPVFYKTDTHWNEFGAFIAYQQLAQKLRASFPEYKPESLADYDLVEADRPGGDLARLLGMQDQIQEKVVRLCPLKPRQAQWLQQPVNSEGRDVRFESITSSCCKSGEVPRAVVFRDSFAVALLEFLGEHVGHMTSVWSTVFDLELIEREKPNVVIFELVQRRLRSKGALTETRPGLERGALLSDASP